MIHEAVLAYAEASRRNDTPVGPVCLYVWTSQRLVSPRAAPCMSTNRHIRMQSKVRTGSSHATVIDGILATQCPSCGYSAPLSDVDRRRRPSSQTSKSGRL